MGQRRGACVSCLAICVCRNRLVFVYLCIDLLCVYLHTSVCVEVLWCLDLLVASFVCVCVYVCVCVCVFFDLSQSRAFSVAHA